MAGSRFVISSEAMSIGLLLLSFCVCGAMGQFPKACTMNKQALESRTCCPNSKDGSMCGSASGRGSCQYIKVPSTGKKSPDQENDDRLEWPHGYFDNLCACNHPYSGFDCGDCVFGQCGDKCEKKQELVRRDIRELSPEEKVKVFSYLSLAKAKKSARFSILTSGNRYDRDTFRFVEASVFDVAAWVRYYAHKPILQNNNFNYSTTFATRGPGFLTWHRWFLLFLEREIQILTADDNFTLPYYDWSQDSNGCSICNDPYMGKSDSQGVLTASSYFGSWKSVCSGFYYNYKYCPVAEDGCKMETLQRSPGANPLAPTLPTLKDVEDTLKWSTYDAPPYDFNSNHSFRNIIEGFMSPSDGETPGMNMHLLVRFYMGGSMAQDTICSADPIFILHHAFIDKIFEYWIEKYGATSETYPTSGIPGQDPEENIVPSFPPIMNKLFLNPAKCFGYSYSNYPAGQAEV